MENFDVVIVGAGAAGLFCAAQAGQLGLRVLVVDNGKKAGRKILMSGGGRCNFTNMYAEPAAYLSQNPRSARRSRRKKAGPMFSRGKQFGSDSPTR